MNLEMKYMTRQDYLKEQEDLLLFTDNLEIHEDNYEIKNPIFGEIWVCSLPILVIEKEKIVFKTQNRPVLIIDDTHEHFIKEDLKNYYGLKITSQKDSYHRILIENYKEIHLKKESFIRLELPLKIERQQCLYKISKIDEKKMKKYLKQISNFIQKQA